MIPRTFAFVPGAQPLQIDRFLYGDGGMVNPRVTRDFIQLRFTPTLIRIGRYLPIGASLTEGFGWKNQDEAAAINEELYSKHIGFLKLGEQCGWCSA